MFCSFLQPCRREAQGLPNLLSLFNYVTALVAGHNPSRLALHSCPASRHLQPQWVWEVSSHSLLVGCVSGQPAQRKDMAWIQLRSEALGPQHPALWSPGDISQALEEEASGGIGCPHPSWHAHSPGVPVGFVWWCCPHAPRIPAGPRVCQGLVQLQELSPSPGTSPPLAIQSLLHSGDSCSLLRSGSGVLIQLLKKPSKKVLLLKCCCRKERGAQLHGSTAWMRVELQ